MHWPFLAEEVIRQTADETLARVNEASRHEMEKLALRKRRKQLGLPAWDLADPSAHEQVRRIRMV